MRNNVSDILLVESIHPLAREALVQAGHRVELLSFSPDEAELIKLLKDRTVLGLRSKTRVTRKVLEASPHVDAIGCFCIGTDQVDLAAARKQGIPVFNAPHSNTRSVAELVIAEIVMLSRQLGDRNTQAHKGVWMKSAEGAHEVRGKTLGIVGYGHIGSQLGILAESFGMRVLFFDIDKKLPLGNCQRAESLIELLRLSDFVSLHVPDTPQTRMMMGREQIHEMKSGAYLINASRGSVVDIEALASALREERLAGAAIDVFPTEPASNKEQFQSPLQGLSNVILTPHIGGSTLEAQAAIGVEVSTSFLNYFATGQTVGAVNFPQLDIPFPRERSEGSRELIRLANVHRNVPGVLGEINSIVSQVGANIRAQALSTDNEIGYVIMDLEGGNSSDLYSKVSSLQTSIKTRVF